MNILLQILIAIITGAFIATFSVKYTFKQSKKLEYYEYIKGVLNEMDENISKLTSFPVELNKLERGWKSFKETWIADKEVAIWPRENRFFYQYLSDNQYNVLKNSGYFRKVVIISSLGLFYTFCRKLNDETQAIEDEFDDIRLFLIKELKNTINFEDPKEVDRVLKNTFIKKSINDQSNKREFELIFEDKTFLFSLGLKSRRGYEILLFSEHISIDDYINNAIQELHKIYHNYFEKIIKIHKEIFQNRKSFPEIITSISTSDMKLRSLGIFFY